MMAAARLVMTIAKHVILLALASVMNATLVLRWSLMASVKSVLKDALCATLMIFQNAWTAAWDIMELLVTAQIALMDAELAQVQLNA